jgi:hypothetical protein
MTIGSGSPITVTNGNGYSSDYCAIWVDWNGNGDFTDAGESVTVTGSPGVGPYSATITPPSGANIGSTRMRVRINYSTAPVPCGTNTYGEVEDYTINVLAASGPANPLAFTATPFSSSQIDLAFTPNAANNNVVIVWNNTGTFTTPTGAPPAIGQPFAGGTLIVNGLGPNYNHTPLPSGIRYYYKAFSYNSSMTPDYSPGLTADAATLCGLASLPYPQSFDGTTFQPDCWALINAGTGNNWVRGTGSYLGAGCMEYIYSSSAAANTWAFTPGVNLTSGKKYFVSFWQKVASATYPEKLKVTVGNTQTVASQTTTLWDNAGGSNLTNVTYIQRIAEYDCSISGTYYFAFNCYSDANMYDLYVDEVLILEQPAIDIAFTQFYQSSGTLKPTGKEKFTDYTVTMSKPSKGKNQFEQLTGNGTGVKSSAVNKPSNNNNIETPIKNNSEKNSFVKNVLNTPLLKNNNNGNNDNPLLTAPIDVATRVTNNGTSAASYLLDWTVGGIAQTQYSGPSVPAGTFNDHTLVYTPTAIGTFLSTGVLTVAGDEVLSNNTAAPFFLRVYPDIFTRNIVDNGTNVVDTYVGWGSSYPTYVMNAGVRYTTGTSAVKLAGVDYIYRTETVTSGTWTVVVRAAGATTLAPGAVLYTKTYTTADYFPTGDAGAYIFFPFDNTAPEIAASTDYWVTITAPLGINYPGGAQAFISGRSFYENPPASDTWVALILSSTEYSWIIRPIETPAAPPALNMGLTAMFSGLCNGTTMNYTKDVTVELHASLAPYGLVESKVVTLDANGLANPVYTTAVNGTPYYIVIKSNNGLETWSATPQTFTGSTLTYDFTSAATQAYGSNELLVGTKWCIISGDVDQNGTINAADRSVCWNDRNLVGVYASDLDGNGTVNAADRSIAWNNRNLVVAKPALVLSPERGVKQDSKVTNDNTTKGKTFDLRLDGKNAKKINKTK